MIKIESCIADDDDRLWVTWMDLDMACYYSVPFDKHADINKIIEFIHEHSMEIYELL